MNLFNPLMDYLLAQLAKWFSNQMNLKQSIYRNYYHFFYFRIYFVLF